MPQTVCTMFDKSMNRNTPHKILYYLTGQCHKEQQINQKRHRHLADCVESVDDSHDIAHSAFGILRSPARTV